MQKEIATKEQRGRANNRMDLRGQVTQVKVHQIKGNLRTWMEKIQKKKVQKNTMGVLFHFHPSLTMWTSYLRNRWPTENKNYYTCGIPVFECQGCVKYWKGICESRGLGYAFRTIETQWKVLRTERNNKGTEKALITASQSSSIFFYRKRTALYIHTLQKGKDAGFFFPFSPSFLQLA